MSTCVIGSRALIEAIQVTSLLSPLIRCHLHKLSTSFTIYRRYRIGHLGLTSSNLPYPSIMADTPSLLQTLNGAEECKSLMKKNLPKEVQEKLKDRKTKLGGTLGDCIRSGKKSLYSSCWCTFF